MQGNTQVITYMFYKESKIFPILTALFVKELYPTTLSHTVVKAQKAP